MKRITTRVKILHLVILAALLAIAMASHAQSTQVNIQVKDVMVKEILKMIEAQSEYRFFYSDDLTYINKKITLNAVSRTIKSVLDEVLRSSDLTYKIEENNLIILVPIQQMQKDNSVTGTITDTGGEPVIGATIVVKGAKTATISDINGKYKITIPNEKAILSYILFGYTTQDVTVGERREINVVLSEEIRRLDLDEVVVVGYGIQNKKTMTGSVSVVNTVDLETSAKSTVSQALQGKAAGLRVQQQSAQAGGGADFKIRGAASPNAGNEPLFIVDGIPISKATDVASFNIYGAGKTDSYLESINPDDIESITVLKDAASTAIYGARAGHGVILITTKRGNKNQNNITYSGNVTVQTIAKNYEMLNAQRYMEVMNKYNYESWLYTSQANVPENIYLGYNRPSTSGAYPGHNFSDQDIANATMTDWVGAVMRTAVLHQHNISLSGGSESLRYLLSGNYMNQEGIIKNNNASRFTIRANVDKDLSKYFSIGLSASYAQNRYDNSAVGEDDDYEKAGILRAAAQFNPTLPIRDADGVYTIDPARATSPNPVSLLEIIDNTVKDRVIGSAYLTVKPITGLELKLQLGGDRMIQKRSNYLPTTTREGMQYNGQGSIVDMDDANYLMTLTAAYSKNFGEHHLRVLTGYEFLKSYTEFSASKSRDYSMESFIYHKLNAGAIQNVESGAWGSSLASYFGRLSYDYAGKYLLEVNLRADGASNFTPENRWGYFPSVAAGWLLSEEAFMESTKKWLANLKVRVSYGETGNYNVGDHTMDYYGVMPWTGWATMFGNTMRIGTEAKGIGNPDITWETTSELNIGLDIGLLKNRITLTAEYFNREIRDLLNELPLMYYFDVNHIYGNIGKTQSRGFEITINTVNFDKKDFDWHTTVTLSHYEDRWKERSPLWRPRGYEKADDYLRPVFDHEAIGILQPGDLPPDYQPTLIPGYVILKNQDGDDKITEDGDKVLLGTADPYLIFGVNNALRYKNLDFSVYFYGEAGALRNGSYMENMASVDGSRNMSLYALNTFSYDNLNATRPSLLAKGIPKGNWDMQKIFFIRCGNIKLGYTIPISKKIVSKLHAYVSVDNAFVLTNWIGLDPETDNIAFSYPNVRSYTLGINISF